MNALRRLVTVGGARALNRAPMVMSWPRTLCNSNKPTKLEVAPGCDLVYESRDAKPINQPSVVAPQPSDCAQTLGKTDKNMSITFTCNVCKTRTQKFFSRQAYTRGLVIIRCPSCQSLHLIADNLGWIKERTPWRIGDQKHLLTQDYEVPNDE